MPPCGGLGAYIQKYYRGNLLSSARSKDKLITTDPVAGATDPVAGELVEPVDVAALSPAVHVVDAVLAGAARVDQLRVPHLAARLVQECQQNKKKLQKNCVSK